jgi:hypothetical protein
MATPNGRSDHEWESIDWVATFASLGLLAFGIPGLRNGFDFEALVLTVLGSVVLVTQLAHQFIESTRRFPPDWRLWHWLADPRLDLFFGVAIAAISAVSVATGEPIPRFWGVVGLTTGLVTVHYALRALSQDE